jgi:hypothetical protein
MPEQRGKNVTDQIHIEQLELKSRVGVTESERAQPHDEIRLEKLRIIPLPNSHLWFITLAYYHSLRRERGHYFFEARITAQRIPVREQF